jgi:hypothetical protein
LPNWRSKRTVAAVAAGTVLVVGGGAAFAATQLDDEGIGGDPESILADIAGRLGVSSDELQAAIDGEARERLDEAVASGQLSEDEAADIEEHLDSGSAAIIEPPGDPGAAFGGPGDAGGGNLEEMVQVAADYIGISSSELVSQVQGGATPAEVAEANGKTAAGLEDALVAEAGEEARDYIHDVVNEGLSGAGGDFGGGGDLGGGSGGGFGGGFID